MSEKDKDVISLCQFSMILMGFAVIHKKIVALLPQNKNLL